VDQFYDRRDRDAGINRRNSCGLAGMLIIEMTTLSTEWF
jgi:hypothetical protein